MPRCRDRPFPLRCFSYKILVVRRAICGEFLYPAVRQLWLCWSPCSVRTSLALRAAAGHERLCSFYLSGALQTPPRR